MDFVSAMDTNFENTKAMFKAKTMKNLFLISGILLFGWAIPAQAQEKTPYVQQIFKITPENFYVGVSPSFTPKPKMDDFTLEQLESFQNGMIDATLTLDIISKWKVTVGVGFLTGRLNHSNYAELTYTGDDEELFWNNYEGIGETFIITANGVFGSYLAPNVGISRPIKLGKIHVTPSLGYWFSGIRVNEMYYARKDLNTGQIIEEIVNLEWNEPLVVGIWLPYPTFGLNVEMEKYIFGIQINDPIYGCNVPDFGLRFGYKL